jgi:ankyrin repeat protein
VYCQLEALRHSLPPSVRNILDDLPESLDETYERVLKDINKANRKHALRLLQCLTVAVRPLRVEELAEVLAVDFDLERNGGIPKLNLDWRWADQHEAVLSTCSSLIAVVHDGDSPVVQFSHFSVKEFLTSERLANSKDGDVSPYHIYLQPAHSILAQACLGVLLCLDNTIDSHNVASIPLAQYAAEHWVSHAQFEDVASGIPEVLVHFFDSDKPHWIAWIDIHDIDKPWIHFTTPYGLIPGANPLYYAALCGFYDVTEYYIRQDPEEVNAKGGQVEAPLVAALLGKHFRVADLLHQHGAEVDIHGWSNRTPLYAASIEGHVEMARWLLDHGADVNGPDARLRVPLYMAAYRGHLEITQLLLERGADVNLQNGWGEVPLHRTASPFDFRDQLKIMKLILDHGAEVDSQDFDAYTPLHHSSWWQKQGRAPTNGSVEGSRMLIEHGANIHAVNCDGKTPLQLALDAGRQDMAGLLTSMGATH